MMDPQTVPLAAREAYWMLTIAQVMTHAAAALGDGSDLSRCLRRQIPDLSATAQARLEPGQGSAPAPGRHVRVVR